MSEDEHTKEVYARFGLAVYYAQVLEHGIVNALIILRFPERRQVTRQDIDAFMEQEFRQTLGRLINDLRQRTSLPSDLETLLSDALQKRNWLCHNYFRERILDFETLEGRDTMILELDESRNLLLKADSKLKALVQPLADQFGVTQDAIDAEYDAMLQSLRE